MTTNNELKDINIKNCACYYVNDIIKIILLGKKSNVYILVYHSAYKI